MYRNQRTHHDQHDQPHFAVIEAQCPKPRPKEAWD